MKHTYFARVLGSSIGLILALLFVGAIGSASANQLAQSSVGIPATRSDVSAPESVPVSSTFTYQGRLGNNGAPVTGTCDLAFRLFDDPSAGILVGSPITMTNVSVADGYFSVGLSFGYSAFTGSARWLDVRVRCPAGSGSFTTLAPRQAVTAAPYALAPWVTNGNTLYYNSGNVGIGTTTPTDKLTVQTATANYGLIHTDGSISVGTWVGTGGSSPAGGWFGTKTNHPLHFFVNDGSPSITISTTGDVGIGTSFPQRRLHVSAEYSGIRLQSYADDAWTTTEYQTDARIWHTGVGGSAVGNDVKSKYYIIDATASQFRMVIDTNGNVGVGTTAPSDKLTVQTATANYGLVHTDGTISVGTWVGTGGGSPAGGWFGTKTNHPLHFFVNNGSPSISINTNGNVGIGTTSPSAKLQVNGVSVGTGGRVIFANTFDGVAVNGTSDINIGVSGISITGTGVAGSGNKWGVYGHTKTGVGMFGYAEDTGIGVMGSSINGYSGFFNGRVSILGPLEKPAGSFKIDDPIDPSNKYLYHSFVESPDMKNIYDGVVALDANGEVLVTLPDWFEALNQDFRYQLTAIGAPGPNLYIAQEIENNRFKIAGGKPGMQVSWQVTGIRHDPYAEQHRIPVEEVKPTQERGKYLYPKEYGQPAALGVYYEMMQQAQQPVPAP